MKRIVFVNQVAGPLLIDMINVFVKKKYEVILYTGKIEKTTRDLDARTKVRKLCLYRKNNNFKRLLTWVLFSLQTLICLIYDLNKTTKIYFSSNPPFVPFISLVFANKTYIHIYDVYPNALLALPYVTKNSIVYRLFLYFNKKAFKKSERVFTPSLGMKKMLMSSSNDKKIKIIPWWADTEFIKPVEKENNKFINKYNLEDKFIVMYSGNFGLTHNIEKILCTALMLKADNNIKFVIIGDGPKKKIVDLFKENNNLKNLLVLPFQEEKMLPFSLAAGDISVVLDSFSSDEGGESTASIPSKTYYFMSAGSVIYAESDSTSELNSLITMNDLGMCDNTQDINKFLKFIKACRSDKKLVNKFQENSRLTSLNFTRKNASLLYKEVDKN
jgi:glycosyltransferase involved in cell wall biosynthesis